MPRVPDILLLTEPIATDALRTLVPRFFEDMVVMDEGVQARMRDITLRLIGRGAPLS